eukprot:633269_1
MAKLSEDEIRIALVNLSSHNIELESLECSQKKFPNVKWRMWKQSYSKNSKSRYHDGYVCAKSDDPAYAQTNGWISRKCTRKYDQRANRSHFTRNKTHWKLHTDAKVGLRKFKSALCRFKKWIISYVLGNNPLRRLQKSQYTAAYSRGDHKEYQPILIAIERIAMESLIIVNNFVQFKTFWDFEQSKKRSSSAWCEPLGSKINKICKKPSGRTPGPQLVDEALIIQTHCDWSQGSINIIASSIANALVDSNKGIRSSGAKHNIKRRKKTMVKGTNRQTNYINRLQHGKETQYCLKYSVKISALRPILSEVALNKKPKQIDWQNTADVDALFAVIDNTEEIYHDIIDKQYIERAAKSIVQPLQTLLKDNPTISARQAKQLIGIDDLPRKTKKLVWKKAWSMINDKDK